MKISSKARKILKKFPEEIRNYFLEVDEKCKQHGVTFFVGAGKQVNSCGGRSGGYFDDCRKILAVSIGSSLTSCFQTLLHEVSHFKGQWLNPKSIWYKGRIRHGHSRFFSYLSGQRIYKKHAAIAAALAIELDCERKTVREIKRRWTKYIDLAEYQRQSSAYLYSYLYMGETGKWPVVSCCIRKIAKHAPDSLQKSYKQIPPKLRMAFDKYLR